MQYMLLALFAVLSVNAFTSVEKSDDEKDQIVEVIQEELAEQAQAE
jgi:hypothetical protein